MTHWRELARFVRADVRRFQVHVWDCVLIEREETWREHRWDCPQCGGGRPRKLQPTDVFELAAVHWLSQLVSPMPLEQRPHMDAHGEFTADWLCGLYRVRLDEREPWNPQLVIERVVRGFHPVEEYEAELTARGRFR